MTMQSRLRDSFSVYARLGNFKVYIQWLPVLIGWALIADPLGLSLGEAVAVVLLMLAALCGAACGGALDHVQGYRDGIDQQTYGAEGVQGGYQTKSDPSIKPLVTGEITDPAARRFGIAIGVLSVLLGTGAVLLAPQAPCGSCSSGASGCCSRASTPTGSRSPTGARPSCCWASRSARSWRCR